MHFDRSIVSLISIETLYRRTFVFERVDVVLMQWKAYCYLTDIKHRNDKKVTFDFKLQCHPAHLVGLFGY